MAMRLVQFFPLVTAAACALPARRVSADTPRSPRTAEDAGVEFFERKIRPLFSAHCFDCHGPDKQEGELRLDGHAAVLAGGNRGPAVVPGDPETSPLVRAVRYTDEDFQMPPSGKLDDPEIASIVEWVRRGAPGPRDSPPSS